MCTLFIQGYICGGLPPFPFPLPPELFPVLDVLDVDDAGEEADEAVVKVLPPSLELPGGEAAEAATDDLEDPPGGDVRLLPPLLVPASGVGLFLEVDVLKSWGDATPVDDVESAYLQLDVDGTDVELAPWRSGLVGSTWCRDCGWWP
uniref:Uncharacterized protein n=1 Tax=Bracon brevicornis TaxID=1563983 RepID=A0A6V7JCI2_9HYME